MWSFFKSVLAGTVAGAALPLCFTLSIFLPILDAEVSAEAIGTILWAFSPLVVAFVIVLAAACIFGLPLFIVLHDSDMETMLTYVVPATVIGAGIMLVTVGSPITVFCGALGGAGTSSVWWRERLAKRTHDERSTAANP